MKSSSNIKSSAKMGKQQRMHRHLPSCRITKLLFLTIPYPKNRKLPSDCLIPFWNTSKMTLVSLKASPNLISYGTAIPYYD